MGVVEGIPMEKIPKLYQRYHVVNKDERTELFEIVRTEFGAQSFVYPGCFVHITPAFFIPKATFVDTDKRAKRFFDDPQTLGFIEASKRYGEQPKLLFLAPSRKIL